MLNDVQLLYVVLACAVVLLWLCGPDADDE